MAGAYSRCLVFLHSSSPCRQPVNKLQLQTCINILENRVLFPNWYFVSSVEVLQSMQSVWMGTQCKEGDYNRVQYGAWSLTPLMNQMVGGGLSEYLGRSFLPCLERIIRRLDGNLCVFSIHIWHIANNCTCWRVDNWNEKIRISMIQINNEVNYKKITQS